MAASAWGSASAIATLLLLTTPALSQTRAWTVVPSIALRETYNDNVALSAAPEHGQFVTDVNPGLSIVGSGRRFSANVGYSANLLFYSRDHDQNRVVNNLNAAGKLEAIERFFFVDAQASVNQTYISPFGPRPSDITTVTNNRTETATVTLSPYVRSVLPGGYTYELRNRNVWTNTDTSFLAKVHTRQWDFNFASPIALFGWAVDANSTNTDYDDPARPGLPERQSRLARGRIFFQPDSTLRFSTSIGREENNYFLEQMQSYDTYGYGATWRPTPRTSADFNWEQRYFGPSVAAKFEHRMRLSSFTVSYTKTASTYQQEVLRVPPGDTAGLLDQIYKARIPDPAARQQAIEQFMRANGTPAFLANSLAFYTEQIFRQERLEGAWAITGLRNSISFTAFRGRSVQLTQAPASLPVDVLLNPGSEVNQHGFGAYASHRLSGPTSLNVSGNRVYAENKDAQVNSTSDFATISLTHTNTPKTTTSGGFTYSHFDSTNSAPVHARSVFAAILHRF